MIEWLIDLLRDFEDAGPVAKAGFALGVLSAAGGIFAGLRRWRQRGFQSLQQKIDELTRKSESQAARISDVEAEKGKLEAERDGLLARDPTHLIRRAEQERKDGNEGRAIANFRRALETVEPALNEAAIELAYHHLGLFTSDEEAVHLAAADHHARLAHHLAPDQGKAKALLAEIEARWGRLDARARDFDRAGQHWNDAFEFSHGRTGKDCGPLIERLATNAQRAIHEGHYHTAFALARRATALAERAFAPESPIRLQAEFQHARSLQFLDEYQAAKHHFEALLAREETVLGIQNQFTLITANALAQCLRQMGDYAEAKGRFEAVLEKCEEVLGPEHPETLVTASSLADCLLAMGDHAEAKGRFEAVLAKEEKVLGPEDSRTLVTSGRLAECILNMRDYVNAKHRFEAVLAKEKKVFGPEHPHTLATMRLLADCLLATGDCEVAKHHLETVLAKQERFLGPDHRSTLVTAHSLADCMRAMGNNAEPRAALRSCWPRMGGYWAQNPPIRAPSQDRLRNA